MEPKETWGEFYRLVKGKGYGEARWWVLSRDGRTEVAGGLSYDHARDIFDRLERERKKPGQVRASLNTRIIDQEDQQRSEMRAKGRNRVIID